MRSILTIFIVLILIPASAWAETVQVKVNGMVCAFCATGIEKTFKVQPAVDSVKVDLEAKQVTINTKDGQPLDDATITKLITDAGYSVTNITRGKQ